MQSALRILVFSHHGFLRKDKISVNLGAGVAPLGKAAVMKAVFHSSILLITSLCSQLSVFTSLRSYSYEKVPLRLPANR